MRVLYPEEKIQSDLRYTYLKKLGVVMCASETAKDSELASMGTWALACHGSTHLRNIYPPLKIRKNRPSKPSTP